MRKALSRVGFIAAFALATASVASASTIGPVYPAPGGSTLALPLVGEAAGNAGGRTYVFTGLNTSAYSDLYWGVWDPAFPAASLSGLIDPYETMAFSSISGNVVTWTGTTDWNDATPPLGGIVPVATKLEISLVSGGTWVSAASLGLNPALGYLVDVSGNAFTTNILFSANTGSGFQPINTVQQFVSNANTKTSFSGAFYYEPVGVPDAAGTFGLLSLAVAGLAAARRRFSSRA
jgi:hypothetical protein